MLSSVTPSRHGTAQTATVEIRGAGFAPGTTFQFIYGDGSVYVPSRTEYLCSEMVTVELDLPSWEAGIYDLVALEPMPDGSVFSIVFRGHLRSLKAVRLCL